VANSGGWLVVLVLLLVAIATSLDIVWCGSLTGWLVDVDKQASSLLTCIVQPASRRTYGANIQEELGMLEARI
jgi:hypothetical protein